MKLSPITLDEAFYVACNMREADKQEIYATRWTPDPWDLAQDATFAGQFGWVASLDRPIAVIGCTPLWPGCWSAFMFATPEFSAISRMLTKHTRRVIIPALANAGAHRVECYSHSEHYEAHRWLEFLGAVRRYERPNYGKNKETFYLYEWDHASIAKLRAYSGSAVRREDVAASIRLGRGARGGRCGESRGSDAGAIRGGSEAARDAGAGAVRSAALPLARSAEDRGALPRADASAVAGVT